MNKFDLVMYRLIFFPGKTLNMSVLLFLDLMDVQVKDIFAGAHANFVTTHQVCITSF